MASIERRGPNQWRVRVRKTGYPLETKTFTSKAQAQRWVRLVESEMDRGLFVSRQAAEQTTLGELIERYREEITPTKKGAEDEAIRLKAMERHPIHRKSLAAVRSVDIAEYRDERLTSASPATVNKELTLLGQVIDIAIKEWGVYVPSNPVRLVRRPALPKARERRLTGDEEERLYQAINQGTRNPWIKPLTQFAIETAMRRGEMLSLSWHQVDLKQRVAHLLETKNGESRDVPLSETAIKILRNLPRSTEGSVFPLGKYSLRKAFDRAVTRADIEDLHFHDLRHEATSRLFEKGLNIMEVSAITGHKDLAMLKRYTHLRAEDLARKLA